MPAPIAPLVAFSLGILFAWAAADGITRASGSLIVSRPFAVTLSFAAFVFLPVAGYFSFFATDWSIAYLFDTRHLPSAVLLLLALFDGACLLGGFAVGAFYVQRRQNVSLLPLMTVPLAVAAVIVAMLGHRLSVHGTYTQVRRGLGAAPLAGSHVGVAILWLNACLLLATLWTVRELRRELPVFPGASPTA